MNRELVSEYLAGYERYVFDELDYNKTGAVPVTHEVHYRLVEGQGRRSRRGMGSCDLVKGRISFLQETNNVETSA